eukprot:1488713-Prymnesium_polylepis.1
MDSCIPGRPPSRCSDPQHAANCILCTPLTEEPGTLAWRGAAMQAGRAQADDGAADPAVEREEGRPRRPGRVQHDDGHVHGRLQQDGRRLHSPMGRVQRAGDGRALRRGPQRAARPRSRDLRARAGS